MLFSIALILASFIILAKASSEAIKRVISLSRHFGVSEFAVSFLLIGVVAVLPELFIGIISALEGSPSFGLGVVIGSNIADMTLVVGLVALSAYSLRLHKSTLKEIRVLILVVALPLVLLFDGELSRADGLVLIISFFAYIRFIIQKHNVKCPPLGKDDVAVGKELFILAISLSALLVSAHLITGSAKDLSIAFSLPVFFIGLLVAVGTCLPELMVSLQATRKKHGELGFGDILGNVFADCMATLGVIALISPVKFEYPLLAILSSFLMLASIIILVSMFQLKNQISRKEGILLIALYIIFTLLQFYAEIAFSR